MRIALQAGLLLAAALAAGVAANTAGPRRIPWTGGIEARLEAEARASGIAVMSVAEAKAALDAGTHLLLDARAPAEHAARRIPWAMSLPWRTVTSSIEAIAPMLDPARPLLVYCRGAACDEGLLLARHLRARGHGNVSLIGGGMEAWRAAGLPVESDAPAGGPAP
ncbi:MAG: rhodanese-like domain-containing protein [Lentisphaerae bacterium]|nr:rhodanese-like domain-containing protein [Lentisphaerota bacterium]